MVKKIGITISIYILGLVLGIGCICNVQKFQQASLKKNAIRAASQLREGKELEDGFLYMHVNIYLVENGEVTCLEGHVSEEYGKYSSYIQKYDSFVKDNKVNYKLVFDLKNYKFIVFSAVSVDETRELFLFHEIRYLGSILFLFVTLYTFIFLLVLIYQYLLRKKNKKVNEIYRCYVANVSHELKSPITSIEVIAETLNSGLVKDEETKSRYYSMIYGEAKHLEHTVKDILALSRIQEHRIDMNKYCVSGKCVFQTIIEKYQTYCEEMNIVFERPENLEQIPDLWTNSERIQEILDILFQNAIKFIPDDQGGIISLKIEVQRKKIRVCVSDNGTGISEKDLPHIFERFYKEKSERNKDGTGLGLAIAKEIIKGLDEEIEVESVEKEGTKFYFSIGRASFRINKKAITGKIHENTD